MEQHPLDAAAIAPTAPMCSPPGISPSRRRWGRRRARRSRPAAATATPSRSTTSRSQRVVHHFVQDDADPGLGAAHARRLRQRVRARILHGRAGGGGRRRSGRVPARASEGPARAGGDRGGRQEGRLEGRREGRRHARPRHRLRQVQEPRLLRGGGRGGRGRPRQRRGARAARLGGGRCRADHQSGRPDRTRSKAASSSR